MKTNPALTAALLLLAGAGTALAADVDAGGFRPLFNGKDLTGWKVRNPKVNNSWSVQDGVLMNVSDKNNRGTDLLTEEKFYNFTVRCEYLVPDGSNSGFYLRGRHEIQILGDYKSGQPTKGGNGALYNHTAPAEFASRPGNEWQTLEATIIGHKITVILNGRKIHDNVVCDKPTGGQLDNQVNEPGPILLQGDHGNISFRNLRLKELPRE